MEAWIQYLIGLVVVFHGLIYLKPPAGLFEEWNGRSWLLGSTIFGEKLKTLSRALWAIAGIGFIGTGIAIVFASLAHGLWRPLAIVGSVVGMLGFGVFWDGQIRRLVNQGAIGVVLDLIILLSAIVFPQAFS